MKFCIISNLYTPHVRGGAERVAEATAQGLKSLGHSVFVVTPRVDGDQAIDEQNGVPVHRVSITNLCDYLELPKRGVLFRLLWHFLNIFNFPAASTTEKILLEEKPDAVITHNLMGVSFALPSVIKRLRIKHVHVLHDVQLAVPSGIVIKGQENSFVNNGFLTKLYQIICKKMFASPDIVVSPSNWLMDFYVNRGFFKNSKRLILRNPLVGGGLTPSPVKSVKQSRFLFVGQLEKHKGIEWLVDLWRRNNIDSGLLIVGNGTIVVSATDNIKVFGRIEPAQLPNIFNQVDYFILPSLCYENSPTAIPLAFLNATPVIVADIGGAAELVDIDKTGFRFAAGDEVSFASALNKAREVSNDEYARMSATCLEQSKSFAVDKYVCALITAIS
ncbi:MAG: glycosyltransferase [Parcubacteria group bacterium]